MRKNNLVSLVTTEYVNAMQAQFPSYKATVTKTVARDNSTITKVLDIIPNVNIIQDPKGRISVYNTDNKVILKYRIHGTDAAVIFFPKRTRNIAEKLGYKLTEHGYFGLEGCIDTDVQALYKTAAAIATVATATA